MYLFSYLERRFKRIALYGARRYIANCAFPWHMGRGTRAQWTAHENARRRSRSYAEEAAIGEEISHATTREAIANGWTYVELVSTTRARVEEALGRRIDWDTSAPVEAARLVASQNGETSRKRHRPAAVARSGGLRGGAAGKWA